jgi:uncharacterized protein (TIGR02996 family)
MSDHDALLAAICAEPDEDTPRLVFADWLEENDQPERAAFVRAQIELARTPAWEPFAVLCRWRRREWLSGWPFRRFLPPLAGSSVEWHEQAFRRGLGWRLNVRSLLAWEQLSGGVLNRAPVGEMHLWGAPLLEQWQSFAASPVVSRLRKVHLMANPIEPLRVLRDSPAALGITDVYFERASGAGMPFVVEELFESPLGEAVRGLHFHMGYESLEELIDALHAGSALERLSFSTMGLTDALVERLMQGAAVRGLTELDLAGNPLGGAGLWTVLRELPAGVHTLGLAATGAAGRGFELFASSPAVASVRRLDLSHNPLTPRAARIVSRSPHLAGLRSLNLNKCRVGERELYHLTGAKFWPNLVELDLRDNPIPPAGVRHLLDAAIPEDLTALVLGGEQLGAEARTELRRRYGERVVFANAGV